MALTLTAATANGARKYDRYGLYGVGHPAGGYLVNDPPGYEDMVWRRIAEAGATSVRQAASWRDIEAVKGRYDWSQLESTLKYCRKYPQIRPYVLVVNTPGWARPDGQPSHLPPKPEAIPDWKRFCAALAKRYRGFVNHYEIWNEQNGFGWEVPPYNQVDKYLPLLEAAYEGLKEGNPDCVVSLGGLDDAAGNSPIFTKGSYDLRLKRYKNKVMWDAFGDHPYGDRASMMAKLRAIKGIAAGYGDCDLELWLTEYGFHSGEMSFEDQAKRLTEYMTTLIKDPEFRYVTETNYLCVADFEETTRGFGLCDANLRPRPAFRAYQRLPRPGQIVIFDIRIEHLSSNSVRIFWRTDTKAEGKVVLARASGGLLRIAAVGKAGKEHLVILNDLTPNTTYSFAIECSARGFPNAKTLDYEFTTLARNGIRNGEFEDGFSIGIARHWECLGRNLCYDTAGLKGDPVTAHTGKSAQCIIANHEWGDGLDDAVAGQSPAQVGKTYTFSAWSYARSETPEGKILRRVGFDPTGRMDPKSPAIVWSDVSEKQGKWERQSVSAAAKSGVITVFIHAETKQMDKGRDYFCADDARVEPTKDTER